MCFRKRSQKKQKRNKIHPQIYHPEEPIVDLNKIKCSGCNELFSLEDIKINCAGCDRFFHCCIAGKCVGKKCNNQGTILGEVHQLSWCIYCVPGLPQNRVGGKTCICFECSEIVQDSK